MLRRVAAIVNTSVEDIVCEWVTDFRRTPGAPMHDDLLADQIVESPKAMLASVVTVVVIMSAGVAASPAGAHIPKAVIAQADAARYRARDPGRDCVA